MSELRVFRESAREFILAVEGFVLFGLGFCLSRPLPNGKTAKKDKKGGKFRIKKIVKTLVFVISYKFVLLEGIQQLRGPILTQF